MTTAVGGMQSGGQMKRPLAPWTSDGAGMLSGSGCGQTTGATLRLLQRTPRG